MSDAEQKPDNIRSLENVIFKFSSKEDLEGRLRVFVASVRGDNSGVPKAYYTDILERIFAEAGYVKPTHPVDIEHDIENSSVDIGKPVDGEIDKHGRKFTYYHGTNAPLDQILREGLKPGSDGLIYLSLREDFASNYGKTMLKVRLPYELERNPFSRTTNGEVRTTTPIKPEDISVTLAAVDLSAHLQSQVEAAVREAEYNLCQRLIEKNFDRTECEINYSALGADVVNTKLDRLQQLKQEGSK